MPLDIYDYPFDNNSLKIHADIYKDDKNNKDISKLFPSIIIDNRIKNEIISAINLMDSALNALESRTISGISSRIVGDDYKTWLILTMHRGRRPMTDKEKEEWYTEN